MSFRTRMYTIVGDENTVARYLTEKIGHTSGLALLLLIVISSPIHATIIASVAYVLFCKFWYHVVQHHPVLWAHMIKDFIFDTWVCALTVTFAIAQWDIPIGGMSFGVWLIGFLIMDNNKMGEPS